jgi:hypothetical protein
MPLGLPLLPPDIFRRVGFPPIRKEAENAP